VVSLIWQQVTMTAAFFIILICNFDSKEQGIDEIEILQS